MARDRPIEDYYSYIENYEQFTERLKRYDKTIFQEGIEAGIEAGIYQAAKNAILAGLPNDTIKIITKLSEEEINKIRRDIN